MYKMIMMLHRQREKRYDLRNWMGRGGEMLGHGFRCSLRRAPVEREREREQVKRLHRFKYFQSRADCNIAH